LDGSRRRCIIQLAVLSSALVFTFFAAVVLGAVRLPVGPFLQVLIRPGVQPAELDVELRKIYSIIWHIRVPRAAAALAAGSALALSGAVVQGLFRNPLASPDVLGISAGSSLGAVLAIVTGLAAHTTLAVPIAAFAGSTLAALFVYFIAAGPGGTHLLYLVLAGLAVSSLLNGIVSAVLVFAEEYALSQFIFWTMGGLEGASWQRVLPPLPFIIVCSIILLALSQPLNLLSLGEEQAHSLGVPVQRLKVVLLLTASALTAMAVATAGPIAFIGLMVPHLVRLLTGPNHRTLLPLSALSGAIFLLVCDIIARIIIAPYEIKTGIITALIGGPYFLFLILRHRRRGIV
jgi:iron complex transport system permease protein